MAEGQSNLRLVFLFFFLCRLKDEFTHYHIPVFVLITGFLCDYVSRDLDSDTTRDPIQKTLQPQCS